MLTVIQNPSDCNFTRSPITCEIETDNMFVSGDFGDKAKGVFYIPITPAAGNHFDLVWSGGTTYTFTFVTGAAGANQISTNPGGLTDSQYYGQVLTDIITNSSILTNYSVTYVGSGGFQFEAINPGPSYTMSTSTTTGTGLSFTNIINGTTNYLSNVPRPNYKIGIDLLVERSATSGVFDVKFSSDKEPVNNRVRFDLAPVLNVFLQHYFPDPLLAVGTLCDQTSKRFFVKFKEFYGTPAVEQIITVVPPGAVQSAPADMYSFIAYCLKAGFSPKWARIQPINQLDAYIWNYPLFLTTQPRTKTIKVFQREYLYYNLPADYADAEIKVRLKKIQSNGSFTYHYYSEYTGTKSKGFTICFPISPDGGVIANDFASGTAVKYEVDLVGSNDLATPISGNFIYIPDRNPLGDDKMFLFKNSYGGVDTFRSEGGYLQQPEFDKEVSSRMRFIDDKFEQGENVTSQHSKKDTIKVYSGYKKKEDLSWLEDLFLSETVVEWDIESFHWIPIILTTKSFTQHKTNEHLWRAEIEYYRLLSSNVTDRLPAAL